MGYEDPCANDPAHGKAMVGIDNPSGDPGGYWVCQACYEQYLSTRLQALDRLWTSQEPPPEPRRET